MPRWPVPRWPDRDTIAAALRPPRDASGVVAWLAWGYLLAVALVAAVMWGLGDRWWGGTVLLFIGRWIFLLPLALLVPAALVARRAALLPLALGAMITLGPVMGLRTGWRALLPAPAGEPLRVVTFNVGGDGGAGATVAMLLPMLVEEWAPDVVAFQECGPALGRAVRGHEGWHHHVDDALCFLSRHPIRESAPMNRSAIERLRANSGGAGGAGFVVRHAVETPAGTVAITNLHLETPRKGLEVVPDGSLAPLLANTEVRELESRLARRWADGAIFSRIVLGDFNTPVESRIFRAHWGDLTNAFSHAGRGFGMTKHNGWIRARIDHVLAGPGWRVRHARTGAALGSDHRPLVVDLVRTGR